MMQIESESSVLVAETRGKGDPTAVGSSLLMKWWVAFSASAVFVVSGHLLIKAGLNKIVVVQGATTLVHRLLNVVLQPEVLAGLLIYSLGTVCWMRAVSQKEISFLYPLSSVNYVLVAAASSILFREVISAKRAAGVVLVVVGMIMMNRRSGAKEQ